MRSLSVSRHVSLRLLSQETTPAGQYHSLLSYLAVAVCQVLKTLATSWNYETLAGCAAGARWDLREDDKRERHLISQDKMNSFIIEGHARGVLQNKGDYGDTHSRSNLW